MVPNTSSWGVRKNWRIVRLAFCSVAVAKSAPPVAPAMVGSTATTVGGVSVVVMEPPGSGGIRRCGLGLGVVIGGVEVLPGHGEEDLVEAGPAQPEVVDLDGPVVEEANDVAQLIRATL